ncbi:hypothetical protein STRCI_003622 [Streptomyces cinnabarinus]|uniref:Uncharacterized protein n=1 Tax=Streptomyces cinnabarinus TaxID=67287 RepID=A0ABY7KHF8_9ACTN|nr:hypothetical protein [Streptomyces cinnabarinus]WAZ22371.1 hypothetical protein STRCI_003622 [Streptomyces cinnabarinus]
MGVLVLALILALVIGGCVCVVWTARGTAPRWARMVAAVTRGLGELLTVLMKSSKGSGRSGSSSDD